MRAMHRELPMKARNSGKHDTDEGQRRLAVLIDADNAQPSVIEGLLAEVAKYGVASVKRIYGDFTSTRLGQWKQVLLQHSINPVQQFAYTRGKNATDSSLIIDAMDLMYTARFDGVCLVSSDSDFTRLAQRLREEGLIVYGFGERKTPDAFVQACDKFVYTEVLRGDETPAPATAAAPAKKGRGRAKTGPGTRASGKDEPPKPAEAAPAGAAVVASAVPLPAAARAASTAASKPAKPPALPLPLDLLRRAIEEASDEQGWAHLGAVGTYLTKIRPDFDPRLYGHRKLSDLVKSHPVHFAVEERAGAGGGKALYVRAIG
jgi:hypothetical protein